MVTSSTADSHKIHKALRAYRASRLVSLLLIFIAKTSCILFGLLTLLQLVFAFVPLIFVPVAWDACIGLFGGGVLVFIIDKFIVNKPSLLSIARALEKKSSIMHPLVSLAMELEQSPDPGSPILKTQAMKIAAEQLPQYPSSMKQRPSRKLLVALSLLLMAWVLTVIFVRPGCGEYWKMPLSMSRKLQAHIYPGTVFVPQHSRITLGCMPKVKDFPSCRIILAGISGGAVQSIMVRPDSSGLFSFVRDSLTTSFSYKFSVGATEFKPETIYVVPPPMIVGLKVHITPPPYIKMFSKDLPEGQGNFSAYQGSSVKFSLIATSGLKSALLCSSNKDTTILKVHGPKAFGEMKIKSKGEYTFKLFDTLGQKSDSLPRWYAEILPDMAPMVHFLKPGKNITLSQALSETLFVEAIDDIGIERCDLEWRKNSDPVKSVHRRSLLTGKVPEKMFRTAVMWDLREAELYPGDTVFYWAFAKDNCPFDTLHHALSETFWFRVPSFEEIHEKLAEEENSTQGALKSAQDKQDNMKTTLSRLLKSTKGKENLSWEEKQVLKDLKQSMQAQSDTLSKAVESLKQTMEKLKEQGLSNKELVDKMDKVRAALEDLAKQYGDSLLFNPPKDNNEMSMQDLKESLDKFKKMLPDLSKKLDSALKYLEMLRRDQRLGQMAMQAQKLGEKQAQIASKSDSDKQKSPEQKELLKKIDDLLSQISKASEDTSRSTLFPKGETPSVDQANKLSQGMKKSLNNAVVPPSSDMNSMSASMFSLAESLRALQSTAMMAKMKKEKDMLMEMANNALNMSQWQEQITADAKASNGASKTALVQEALKQALSKSAKALNSLSMTPPQTLMDLMHKFDKADKSMGESMGELESDGDVASRMESSQQSLNALAFSLMNAAESMDGSQGQGQGGEGMESGMQKLSGKQAMINSATGEILRQMLGEGQQPGEGDGQEKQGGKGKNALLEKARQQAAQAQKEVANELKKLAEKYGKEAGSSMDKRAKDLEEEALRLTKMLEEPRPEITDRQERFLSRMIESTVSMHKQDEGKEERKSESAKNIFSLDNKNSLPTEALDRDSYYRLRQKAFSSGFPEIYRSAVTSYFDSLGVLFLREK